ncbi:class I SAM-dependent methyltransferase [candidate division KSB1 bacterium]|nr:class I SAM-dependent methyltransferase [candidate division KSB1 bacterium]
MNSPKSTSFEYGSEYQAGQAEKFRNRKNNHWKHRIALANRLVENYVLPKFTEEEKSEVVVVDVGCSIGTFAIEFAMKGYKAYGVDFDASALVIARQLAKEENVSPVFVRGDVSNWSVDFPKIDIALCFDIFEHLHDDELGAFLVAIKRQLSDKGSLVFHTFPAQFDYILFSKPYLRFPVKWFRYFSTTSFNKIVRIYAKFIDILFLLKKGITYQESIKKKGHCNPTTVDRLTDILQRSGYEIKLIEAANLYDFKDSIQKYFAKQPVSYRNIYGVAVPKIN